MGWTIPLWVIGAAGGLGLLRPLQTRIRLERAKPLSLQRNVALARRVARLIPAYALEGDRFYRCDGVPEEVAAARRAGLERLAAHFGAHAPRSREITRSLKARVSDAQFTDAHRVPFPFRDHVRAKLPLGAVVAASEGCQVRDADGNWAYDLSGSYGFNVLGYELYKDCLDRGFERARELGPALGGYHPVVADNAERLARISGLEAVSFHMSGTEAVMQAVRLSRYHTGARYAVRFAGAYHGWWDGVQATPGNQRPPRDLYTLRDMSERSLKVLRTRRDIACVLVSPLQALHPNKAAPGDGTLFSSDRSVGFDRAAYTSWLRELRAVTRERGIPLIFDEVFAGFRLARGGAQEYFGVDADLVTYGKSLGGGLPVGVLCGRAALMSRFREDRPGDLCFARGTFNAHPYVMTSMNAFLERLEEPGIRDHYDAIHDTWDRRAKALNDALAARGLPVRVGNMASILSVLFTAPSRYNWLFQYYLRAQGLALSWMGTGRLIMSHDYTDDDFAAVRDRFVAAAEAMEADGWWWRGDGLTNRAIKRQVAKEMLRARISRTRSV